MNRNQPNWIVYDHEFPKFRECFSALGLPTSNCGCGNDFAVHEPPGRLQQFQRECGDKKADLLLLRANSDGELTLL